MIHFSYLNVIFGRNSRCIWSYLHFSRVSGLHNKLMATSYFLFMIKEAKLFKHDTLWEINDNIYSMVNLHASRKQILVYVLKTNCESGGKWKSSLNDKWRCTVYSREVVDVLSKPDPGSYVQKSEQGRISSNTQQWEITAYLQERELSLYRNEMH